MTSIYIPFKNNARLSRYQINARNRFDQQLAPLSVCLWLLLVLQLLRTVAFSLLHRPITLFYHKMIAWIQYKRKTRKERNKNKEAQTENVRLTPVIYQLAKKNRTHSRLLKCLAVGYYWTVSTFTPLPHNSQAFSLFFSLAFMFHTIAMQHIAPHTQLLYITCS